MRDLPPLHRVLRRGDVTTLDYQPDRYVVLLSLLFIYLGRFMLLQSDSVLFEY